MADHAIEGWTWLHNTKKWHYFRGLRSLCGKFLMFVHPHEGYELGGSGSPDNCKACIKKLEVSHEHSD